MKTVITAIAAWVFGMTMFLPASAWAVHPFQVEDTDVQGPANLLLELFSDYTKNSGQKEITSAGVLNVGVSDSVDLALEVPYLVLDPSTTTNQNAHGLGDVELKFKHRVYENEVHQSFGYQVFTSLPTGDYDQGLGTNNVIVGFKLMDQQGCCNTIFHVSVGYESYAKDLKEMHFSENSVIQFGVAVEHKLTESFWLLSELLGEDRKGLLVGTGPHPYTFMAGFRYDISKSWYADLAARFGLNSDAEDYSVLAGTAWRF